jgi:hypothetical protein
MNKANWSKRVGFFLIILSCVLYGLIAILPFLPLSTPAKIAAAPALVLLGELTFWPGSVLLGKEVITRYKAYLDPRKWCAKKAE